MGRPELRPQNRAERQGKLYLQPGNGQGQTAPSKVWEAAVWGTEGQGLGSAVTWDAALGTSVRCPMHEGRLYLDEKDGK